MVAYLIVKDQKPYSRAVLLLSSDQLSGSGELLQKNVLQLHVKVGQAKRSKPPDDVRFQ